MRVSFRKRCENINLKNSLRAVTFFCQHIFSCRWVLTYLHISHISLSFSQTNSLSLSHTHTCKHILYWPLLFTHLTTHTFTHIFQRSTSSDIPNVWDYFISLYLSLSLFLFIFISSYLFCLLFSLSFLCLVCLSSIVLYCLSFFILLHSFLKSLLSFLSFSFPPLCGLPPSQNPLLPTTYPSFSLFPTYRTDNILQIFLSVITTLQPKCF